MKSKADYYFIAIPILYISLFFIGSCSFKSNRLVGHIYIIQPVNEAIALKMAVTSANITHEYESGSKVRVITYIGKEATKSEELTYSLEGDVYRMENEIYNVKFRNDTVILSIDSSEYLKLIPVK